MAKMIVVNELRCLGCKSCELQCALAHSEAGNLVEAIGAESPPKSRVHVQAMPAAPGSEQGQNPLFAGSMPLQCRHCEDAPCMSVCPTGAIYRPDDAGPVLVDADRCIGCKFCLVICPFGVMDLSRDGKAAMKCDRCIDRTAEGEAPACVAACPTGAIEFIELDEYLRRQRQGAAGRFAQGRAKAQNVER